MTYRIDDILGVISAGGGIAKTNLWQVQLPSLGEYNTSDLNLLCRNIATPGRSISQTDLTIGLNKKMIANGFGVTPLQATFIVLNDPKILTYFETWQSLAVDQNSYEIGYYDDYVRNIKIHLLKKGIGVPIFKKQFNLKLPSEIKNRLPTIGPLNLSQNELEVNFITKDKIVHSYNLLECYPQSVVGVTLSNEAGGLMEISVEFVYRDWTSEEGNAAGGGILDKLFDKIGI